MKVDESLVMQYLWVYASHSLIHPRLPMCLAHVHRTTMKYSACK